MLSKTEKVQYSQTVAARMINICSASYGITSIGANNNKCPQCYTTFQVYKVIHKLQQLVIVGFDPTLNSVVVAFRGSKEPSNFLQDAAVMPVQYGKGKSCKVHWGFKEALEMLYSFDLKQVIDQELQNHPGSNIIFTGHSLGGALANLSSLTFVEEHPNKYPKLLLYTFGQPRVGNHNYADYHNKLIPNDYRVVHHLDPIPHLPPQQLLFGYIHTGYKIWYDNNMQHIISKLQNDSWQGSNSALLMRIMIPKAVYLIYHDYHKYMMLWNRQGFPKL